MNRLRLRTVSMASVLLAANFVALEAADKPPQVSATSAKAEGSVTSIDKPPPGTFALAVEPEIAVTVPLRISAIPAGITGGTIICKVGEDGMDNSMEANSGPKVIRTQSLAFSLNAAGAVTGNFVVHVKESSPRSYSQAPLSAATRYACFLRLGGLGSYETRDLAQPGAPLVQIVSGAIPR